LEISVNSTLHGLFKENAEELLTVVFTAQFILLMLSHTTLWPCRTSGRGFQWVSSVSYGI